MNSNDAALAALRDATAAYSQVWWRSDLQADAAISERPELHAALEAAGALVTTRDVHWFNNTWRTERTELHSRLVDEMLGNGAHPDPPVAYFTIGPMGAGKSTTLRRVVDADRERKGYDQTSLSRIAADDIRERLPEYAGGVGSMVVEAEAFEVTYARVVPAAVAIGMDAVYDTIGRVTGGVPNFRPQLEQFKAAGFDVHVLVATCGLDECRRRVARRALVDNGRFVDLAALPGDYDQPMQALRMLCEDGLLAEWAVVDTSGTEGELPMLQGTDYWARQLAQLRFPAPDRT